MPLPIDGFNTQAIDVHDAAYQADPAFKPDKLEMWAKIPVEQDGWVLAHNALRHELSEFQKACDAVGSSTPLVGWQVSSIQSYIKGHVVHVHEHHQNEDAVFNPFLRTRIKYPEKLEADHVQLVETMKRVEAETARLAEGATLGALATLWAEYASLMLPHLHEEEVVGLPLARAFFTPAEVAKVTESFVKDGDPVAMGSFVHVNGSKKANMTFMRTYGIPFFVWYIPGKGFKALRTLYRKHMQSHVDSLIAGKPVLSLHTPKTAKAARDKNTSAQANAANQLDVKVLGER